MLIGENSFKEQKERSEKSFIYSSIKRNLEVYKHGKKNANRLNS